VGTKPYQQLDNSLDKQKRTRTTDGSDDELAAEEDDEEEIGAGTDQSKIERREREIARILEAEAEEDEELPSLGFSDDGDDELASSRVVSSRRAHLDVPVSRSNNMSPPPSPIARSAPSSSPASPSLQQFNQHVEKVKKRMRDEDEVDTGVKGHMGSEEKETPAYDGDAAAAEPELDEEHSRGRSTPDTSPTKRQQLKLESPTKNTPSPRRSTTQNRNSTPLPSRIIRYALTWLGCRSSRCSPNMYMYMWW
jgi:hypothetical protein